MKNLELENKMLVFGKASFNTIALKGITKSEFLKKFSGALDGQDVKDVWKQLSKYTKIDKVSKSKISE